MVQIEYILQFLCVNMNLIYYLVVLITKTKMYIITTQVRLYCITYLIQEPIDLEQGYFIEVL